MRQRSKTNPEKDIPTSGSKEDEGVPEQELRAVRRLESTVMDDGTSLLGRVYGYFRSIGSYADTFLTEWGFTDIQKVLAYAIVLALVLKWAVPFFGKYYKGSSGEEETV